MSCACDGVSVCALRSYDGVSREASAELSDCSDGYVGRRKACQTRKIGRGCRHVDVCIDEAGHKKAARIVNFRRRVHDVDAGDDTGGTADANLCSHPGLALQHDRAVRECEDLVVGGVYRLALHPGRLLCV